MAATLCAWGRAYVLARVSARLGADAVLGAASHCLCASASNRRPLPRLRYAAMTRDMSTKVGNARTVLDSSSPAADLATVGLTKASEQPIPELEVRVSELDVSQWKGDLLAIAVFEGGMSDEAFGILDKDLNGLLADVAAEEDFTGKSGQASFVRIPGQGFKRIGLVGLGKLEKSSLARPWKGVGESIAAAAKTAQASSVGIVLSALDQEGVDSNAGASAITSGVILGSFEDTRFKSEPKAPKLKRVEILGLGSAPELEKKLQNLVKVCTGVISARQLVNAPANVLTPSALAEEAVSIASSHSDVFTAKILDEAECKELKMGSYLGVAAASVNPPKFIHLQYKPPSGDVKTKLAIIGKGLTFDSGGYNLKIQGSSIELMKFDMGGAAAALGAAKALGAIQPLGVEVHFIVAACENMISGAGMRPGDILTASNGKTIEVNNTDAEGRLTLADALVYACNLKVDKIVDLATLTGACIIALGNEIGGMFTPSDELAEELSQASSAAGEKLWRMPMEENYWEMMKSGIADMVNTGGRPGGSITASLFLKQFVDEKIPWAHLDIAGPVWNEKKKMATGFAVGTLVEWVSKHASSS
ncbi:leucine aminopeptidase 1 [Selaginella moellendorffii]|nr:leucine aminopeptidase 1 [Selaginella moellendorffii]|eukprot:XP_002965045.2 leucine aminopeptidase 1 [Selaginella moellendorffii]